MDKIIQFLEKNFVPVAGKMAAQKHLQAIRDGMVLSTPLLIFGSFFLVLGFLPIPGYEGFMAGVFGPEWLTKLLYPVNITFGLLGVFVSIGVAYRLAEKYKVDALSAGAVSLAAYMLLIPFQVPFTPEGAAEAVMVGGVVPTFLLGSQGMFVAIITAIFTTEIFRRIIQKGIVIRMPEGVPPAVARSFIALIPASISIGCVWLIRIIFEATSYETVFRFINTVLGAPLTRMGTGLGGTIVAVLFIHLLWAFGLHGANIVDSVMLPIWRQLSDQNRMVFQADPTAILPNIATREFLDVFILIGGSGATLVLCILMLRFAKSKQLKQLGRLSIGSGIFNINEPIIFGMPIVMNPLMMIPFILGPVVVTIVSYIALKMGLVARLAGIAMPWTSPILLSGFLASGGKLSVVALQMVNFLIMAVVYYPFFRIWDKKKLEEEKQEEAKSKTA
ncbi:MAG: PTS cellobiose transporter subunit IIC [Thermotaleaceae bacterium]